LTLIGMAALFLNSLLVRPPLVKAPIHDDLDILFPLKNAAQLLFLDAQAL